MNRQTFVQSVQFLFVGGILGEVLSLPGGGSYFKTNIDYIKKEYKNPHCYRYMPPSPNKTSHNAQKILNKIKLIYQKNKKPVVIIAHSKGCQECLYLALIENEIFKSKVLGIAFIQGSFLGSSLIEILLGKVEKTSSFYSFSGKLLKHIPAINDLRTGAMYEEFKTLVDRLSEQERGLLERRLLNIISVHQKDKRLAHILKLGFSYYENLYALESDGLVSREQQQIPFLKVRNIEFKGDHSFLFTSWPVASSTSSQRKEETDRLLGEIIASFSPDLAKLVSPVE